MPTLAELLLILLAGTVCAAEGNPGDGEVEIVKEEDCPLSDRIASISMDMYSLHDDLRDDRHDKNVQARGEEIRKKIQKIIDEAEERDGKNQSQSKGRGDGPLPDSKIAEYDSNGERIKKVSRRFERDLRDDIVHTQIDPARPIVGERDGYGGVWGLRVQAYFYSIAVEAAKRK